MTRVSSTHAPQSAHRPAAHEPLARSTHAPDDAKSLKDALVKARAKVDRFVARQSGDQPRADPKQGEAVKPKLHQQSVPRYGGKDRDTSRPVAADRAPDGQGIATAAPNSAPPPIMMPTMPAPQVDPSGFARMLADLWTRENGKGAKEVRVRFGESAWPATGAELVRNAAGALDIALDMAATPTNYDRQVEGLDRHLRDAGLQVGTLSFATGITSA